MHAKVDNKDTYFMQIAMRFFIYVVFIVLSFYCPLFVGYIFCLLPTSLRRRYIYSLSIHLLSGLPFISSSFSS